MNGSGGGDDHNNGSCPFGGSDPFTPALVTVQMLVAAAAVLGNATVITLIARHESLHTPNNMFVAALAVADLLVAANIPFYISFYFDVPFKCNRTLCLVRYVVALYVTLLSVLLLAGVAVDRHLSIVYPFKYQLFMRFKLAK
jgi:hypothetical protein